MRKPWAAVIAAGGEAPPELQAVTGEKTKALAAVNGIPSVVSVARAAIEAGCSPIVIACNDEVARRLDIPGVEFAAAGSSNVSTTANAVVAAPGSERILLLPSDLPRIRSEHIVHFLAAIEERVVDSDAAWFAVGLCPENAIKAAHPGARFTYLRLSEGKFASGGLYASSRAGFEQARDTFERASKDRKSQLRLVLQFGLSNAMRYLTGRMSIENAEKSAAKVLKGKCIIVPDCHPDTTLDFDTAEDYNYLQSLAK